VASREPKEASSFSFTAPPSPVRRRGELGLSSRSCLTRGKLAILNNLLFCSLVCISPKYDVCYIEIPQRSLNDAQMNAEYVAAAIQILAPQSKAGGKLFIIGHSQGNIVSDASLHTKTTTDQDSHQNIQWALLYWPSLRNLVSGFSSLAGDFKG
jgi:hypothetical protein